MIIPSPKDQSAKEEILLKDCPLCGENFFIGNCGHDSIDLITEIERLLNKIKIFLP